VTSTRRDVLPTTFSIGGASCTSLGLFGSGASCATWVKTNRGASCADVGERVRGSASYATLQLRIRDSGTSCVASLLLGDVRWPGGLRTRTSNGGPRRCKCRFCQHAPLGFNGRGGRPPLCKKHSGHPGRCTASTPRHGRGRENQSR
jgi:hypothetical protein